MCLSCILSRSLLLLGINFQFSPVLFYLRCHWQQLQSAKRSMCLHADLAIFVQVFLSSVLPLRARRCFHCRHLMQAPAHLLPPLCYRFHPSFSFILALGGVLPFSLNSAVWWWARACGLCSRRNPLFISSLLYIQRVIAYFQPCVTLIKLNSVQMNRPSLRTVTALFIKRAFIGWDAFALSWGIFTMVFWCCEKLARASKGIIFWGHLSSLTWSSRLFPPLF